MGTGTEINTSVGADSPSDLQVLVRIPDSVPLQNLLADDAGESPFQRTVVRRTRTLPDVMFKSCATELTGLAQNFALVFTLARELGTNVSGVIRLPSGSTCVTVVRITRPRGRWGFCCAPSAAGCALFPAASALGAGRP